MKFVQAIRSFIRDEDGAAAIEYGLIAALIAIAIIVGATLLGTSLDGLFTRLGNCMATPTVAVCVARGLTSLHPAAPGLARAAWCSTRPHVLPHHCTARLFFPLAR